MKNNEIEYKNIYTAIFSSFYLLQGLSMSIFAVIIPIYLLTILGTLDMTDIANLASVVMIPWAVKFFFGILGDKIGFKEFGRRRPWIIIPGIFAGIIWICIPLLLTIEGNAYFILVLVGLFANLGVAMEDTATDGLILDICPKQQLGRTQGFCWGFRSVGAIAGGPLTALLMGVVNIDIIFIIVGALLVVITSLMIIIKEPNTPKIRIGQNLKMMVFTKKNWKVFSYALFDAVLDGFIMLFIALFILIQLGLVDPAGASIAILQEDINLYIPQANINLLVSIGIVIGAIIGGRFADLKSRRISVYIGYAICIGSFLLMLINVVVWLYFIFAIIIGVGSGWRIASYSAVMGQVAKQYPEMDSTFFSLGNSFANTGTAMGLFITGAMFSVFEGFSTNYLVIFGSMFIFIALLQCIGPLIFSTIKPIEYEYKDKEFK